MSKKKSKGSRDQRNADLRYCSECGEKIKKREAKTAQKRGLDHVYCEKCSSADNLA